MLDPFTLTMAGIGAAQAIGAVVPTKYDKANKQAIRDLEAKKAKGQLGLTDEERQRRSRDLLAPVRAATTQVGQQQARALAASGQGLGGADLSAIRNDAGRTIGGAGMQAQAAIGQQDEQKKAGQIEELNQRQAFQASRKSERTGAAFQGIATSANAVGQLAGAAPGTTTISGAFGTRLKSGLQTLGKTIGLSDIDQQELAKLADLPGGEQAARQALRGVNLQDPKVAEIAAILKRSGQPPPVPVPEVPAVTTPSGDTPIYQWDEGGY